MLRKAFLTALLSMLLNSLQTLSGAQANPSRADLQNATTKIVKAEIAKANHDCEDVQGQQPYNICMGEASATLERDYKTFYNNLRVLLAPVFLKGLDDSEALWLKYREQICNAAYEQFTGGTAAPGAQAGCYLQVTRAHMQTLRNVFETAWH